MVIFAESQDNPGCKILNKLKLIDTRGHIRPILWPIPMFYLRNARMKLNHLFCFFFFFVKGWFLISRNYKLQISESLMKQVRTCKCLEGNSS